MKEALHIADDSDDFRCRVPGFGNANALTNRLLVGPERSGETLVHHHHGRLQHS